MSRIGIFSGSFDPVHKGHIAFAKAAMEDANLDTVYFLPETLPRHKPGISHIGHRVAMLKLATRGQARLKVLDMPDKRFSVATTLPRLLHKFKGDTLLLVLGSDVVMHLPQWAMAEELLRHMGLIVAIRADSEVGSVMEVITSMPRPLKELHIIASQEPALASKRVREQLRHSKSSPAVLPSVNSYAKKHWLYDSITTP